MQLAAATEFGAEFLSWYRDPPVRNAYLNQVQQQRMSTLQTSQCVSKEVSVSKG